MNCSTSTIGVTTAEALRPLRGTEEKATPHTAPAAVPSTKTQANVVQRAASVGRSTPKATAAMPISSTIWMRLVTSTEPTLPRKYAAGGIGVPRSRLRPPSSRSTAIPIARFWKLDSRMPVATMPGRKYCANGMPGSGPTVEPS